VESPKLSKELADYLQRHPFLIAKLYGVTYNIETRWYADGRVETEKMPKPALGPIPDEYLWSLCRLEDTAAPFANMNAKLSATGFLSAITARMKQAILSLLLK
jgi:hypothetical protein